MSAIKTFLLLQWINSKFYFVAGDDVVPFQYGEKSANSLSVAGFRHLMFKSFEG